MSNAIIQRANDIIAQLTIKNGAITEEFCEFCTLALIDDQGYPTASVITASKSDGINWLAFSVGLPSNKVKRIQNCTRASVSFNSLEYCINLVGDIEIITDAAVKEEMWYEGLEYHFPGGKSDPNYCVLKFKTKRYQIFFMDEDDEVTGTL